MKQATKDLSADNMYINYTSTLGAEMEVCIKCKIVSLSLSSGAFHY